MTFTCDASRGDANPFIERNFYDCVYTTRDLVGFSLGMVSILLWLVAQVPQLLSNIKNQSSEALSVWFLTQWFLGDTLNLLGCLISGTQLATTTYLAMYFVVSDVVMLTQFIYFGALKARKQKLLERFQNLKQQHRHRHHHHRHHSLNREFGSESQPRPSPPSLIHPDKFEYSTASEPFLRSDHRVVSEATLIPSTIQEEPGTPSDGGGDSGQLGTDSARVLDPVTGSPYRTAALLVTGTATLSAVMLACVTLGMQYAQSHDGSGGGSSSTGGAGPDGGMVALSPREWLEGLGWGGGDDGSVGGTAGGTSGDFVVRSGVAAVGPLSVLTALDVVALGGEEWVVLAGTAIGYCSSCLYIVSRLSQIFKNRSRQSAEGLSIAMFALAFCGNLCTGTSILLRATGWAGLKTQLPWVCGTFGTVALDGFIFRQALLYGTGPKKTTTVDDGTPDKRQYTRIDVT